MLLNIWIAVFYNYCKLLFLSIHVVGSCDPVIDEHFRRSLGKDYQNIFSKSSGNNVSITGIFTFQFYKSQEKWLFEIRLIMNYYLFIFCFPSLLHLEIWFNVFLNTLPHPEYVQKISLYQLFQELCAFYSWCMI